MPLGTQPALFVETASGDTTSLPIDDGMLRSLPDATFRTPGVADTGHLQVTQHAGGANFTVDVAAGLFVVAGIAAANEGKYVGRNPTVYTVNCGSSPSSSLPKRLDSIVLFVRNKNTDANSIAGVAGYQPEIVLVPGTPTTGTPAAPSLPSALNTLVGPTTAGYLELARVNRTSTEISIATAAITDVRTLVVPSGVGGRTVSSVGIGLGTYNPAKPVLTASAYVELATDASGYLNISTPASTTCVVFATGTYVYRQAPIPAAGAVNLRLDASTTSSLRWQFRNLSDGSVIASQFVGFWYRVDYQL